MTVLNVAPSKEDDDKQNDSSYAKESVTDIVRARSGWLVIFCVGLLLAAAVVKGFERFLEQHVQLSLFLPLIMGHGGNAGAQSCSAVLRALALQQVSWRDVARTVAKEAQAGLLMGALLGALVFGVTFVWPAVSSEVGLVVAIALPAVSLWANASGAFFTLAAHRLKFDPAVTSVPLMTTIVDLAGIAIYFYIAECVMGIKSKQE